MDIVDAMRVIQNFHTRARTEHKRARGLAFTDYRRESRAVWIEDTVLSTANKGSPLALITYCRGILWKSALQALAYVIINQLVSKSPGRRRVGKEWTTMEPDSEIKLVRVSEGPPRTPFRGLWVCVWRALKRTELPVFA